MHLTLMHNPNAGNEEHSKHELLKELRRAGHEVDYYSTKKKDFRRGLHETADVVVIAGGDGTVRKVGRRLIGHNVPIAILPLGTANNIATALGLDSRPELMIRALEKGSAVKFDVGVARGPWGDMPFLEGAGAGLFARMISEHESNRKKGVPDAAGAHGGKSDGVQFLQQVLATFRGCECSVKLDGQEVSGTYLWIEALNIPAIGPGFELAPNAHPADGLLDVVLVKADQRQELQQHLAMNSGKRNRPPFPVHRVREMQIRCLASDFHFDDRSWPLDPATGSSLQKPFSRDSAVEVAVFPGALRVLVP